VRQDSPEPQQRQQRSSTAVSPPGTRRDRPQTPRTQCFRFAIGIVPGGGELFDPSLRFVGREMQSSLTRGWSATRDSFLLLQIAADFRQFLYNESRSFKRHRNAGPRFLALANTVNWISLSVWVGLLMIVIRSSVAARSPVPVCAVSPMTGRVHENDSNWGLVRLDGGLLVARCGRSCFRSVGSPATPSLPPFGRCILFRSAVDLCGSGGGSIRFLRLVVMATRNYYPCLAFAQTMRDEEFDRHH